MTGQPQPTDLSDAAIRERAKQAIIVGIDNSYDDPEWLDGIAESVLRQIEAAHLTITTAPPSGQVCVSNSAAQTISAYLLWTKEQMTTAELADIARAEEELDIAIQRAAAAPPSGQVVVDRDDLAKALEIHRDIPCDEDVCFAVYRLHDALKGASE